MSSKSNSSSSSVNKKVQEFKKWAITIGCPVEYIPPEDLLIQIFQSKDATLFNNMMTRIKPKAEVQKIKNTILLSKMKAMQGKENSAKESNPEEYETYLKVQKLESKIKESTDRMNATITAINIASENVKKQNLEKLNLLEKIELAETKIAVYNAKSLQLSEEISAVEKLEQEIEKLLPAKPNDESENLAASAAKKCLELLQEFYKSHQNDMKNPEIQNDFWKKMQPILQQVPRQQLVDVLEKINCGQFEEMKLLATTSRPKKEDPIKLDIYKLFAQHIKLVIHYTELKQQYKEKKDEFVELHVELTDYVNNTCHLNFESHDEAVGESYVEKLSTKLYTDAKIESVKKEIDREREQIAKNKELLKGHDDMLRDVKDMYAQHDELIASIQKELYLAKAISEKFVASKLKMNCQMKEVQSTIASNYAADSKLELPDYAKELEIFDAIPLQQFKMSPDEIDFSDKSVVSLNLDIDQLMLFPNHLLTLKGSLTAMQQFNNFQTKLNVLTSDLVINIDAKEVDEDALKARFGADSDYIYGLLQSMRLNSIRTEYSIEEATKYLNFLIDNPLKNFVPSTKLFEGRTFSEYEKEFLTYYRMIYGNQGLK